MDVQCKLWAIDTDIASLCLVFQAAWDKLIKDFHNKPMMTSTVVREWALLTCCLVVCRLS